MAMGSLGELRILISVTDKASQKLQKISTDTKKVKDEFKKTSASSDKLKNSTEGLLKKMTKMRWALVNVFLVLTTLRMAWKNVISPAVEYGAKVAQVSMITGASLQKSTSQIEELRENTIFSLDDIAKSLVEVSRRGFDFADSVMVMKTATDLALVGFVDLDKAMDVLTTSMRQFFLSADDSQEIASILANVSLETAADLESLGASMSYVGPVAFAMGMSLAETAAILGILADAGIRSSKAGTSTRQMLLALADPSSEAAVKLQNLGITIFDLKGDFVGLSDVVQQMAFVFSGDTQDKVQTLSNIFGRRAAPSIATLIEQVQRVPSVIDDMTESISDANKSVNTLADSLDNTSFAIKESHSAFGAFFMEIGKGSREIYGAAISWVAGMRITQTTIGSLKNAVNAEIITEEKYWNLMKELRAEQVRGNMSTLKQIKGWEAHMNIIMELNQQLALNKITQKEVTAGIEESANANAGERMALHDKLIATKDINEAAEVTVSELEGLISTYNNLDVAINANRAAEENLSKWLLKGSGLKEEKITKLEEEYQAILKTLEASDSENVLTILGNKLSEDRKRLAREYTDEQIKLIENTEILNGYQNELNKTQKDWNRQIKENAGELSKVRREIRAFNDLIRESEDIINKLSRQRFTGETGILGLMDKLDIYIKKQKLADLGIGDAQAFLREQIGRSTDSMDDLIAKQEESLDLSKQSQNAYNAWRESIETAIRAEVMAGGDLNKDVTDRVKTWQTQLLGIQAMGGGAGGETSEERYLNKLKLAYDVYYGGQRNQISQFMMEEEDKANGVATNAEQIISAITAENEILIENRTKLNDVLVTEQGLIEKNIELREDMDLSIGKIQENIDKYVLFEEQIQATINKMIELNSIQDSIEVGETAKSNVQSKIRDITPFPQGTTFSSGESITPYNKRFGSFKEYLNEEEGLAPKYKLPFGNTSMFGDFISRPGQPIAAISPQDTVVGTKNGGGGGNTINVSVNVSNSNANADDIARAIKRELNSY